ncbi:MAG: DUF1284 domain-containing protein [Methanobrevibacter sp.]|uniref:DUF1284 domain-containing protein n=1 Tax=Methanobrevibacter sp. TaxID=66852 RepID=UPI0026DEF152|nr:DUF1284 domain-containing protein [Methanobrevibacter sp.]MDO5848903.1 DUF1284 domain-containing protein [Methanobrevibacter sp.]
MKLNLRGHHILCLQGFQGYGYDESFVENMTCINEIRKKEDTRISVCNHPDDICKACPNLVNGICVDETENEKIIKMDDEVLEKLSKTDFESSKELFDLINSIFKTKSSVKDICSNCKWMDKCLFVQNL